LHGSGDSKQNHSDQVGREPAITPKRRRFLDRGLRALGVAFLAWILAAYVVLPILWEHYEHQPALQDAPKWSTTAQGIPGDPLNLGLIGSEADLVAAMLGSGWDPADPITLGTSFRLARSVLRKKPYHDAPVSNLFLFGRKQDFAFEKPAGVSASRRHHVRFWRSVEFGRDGVPLWCGAVTFDRSAGLSHTTGQITHHIGPDIDAERDALIAGLRDDGRLAQVFEVTGVGSTLIGRNGGGDRYFTDGEMAVAVLAPVGRRGGSPDRLANPATVRIKKQLWSTIRPLLRSLPDP